MPVAHFNPKPFLRHEATVKIDRTTLTWISHLISASEYQYNQPTSACWSGGASEVLSIELMAINSHWLKKRVSKWEELMEYHVQNNNTMYDVIKWRAVQHMFIREPATLHLTDVKWCVCHSFLNAWQHAQLLSVLSHTSSVAVGMAMCVSDKVLHFVCPPSPPPRLGCSTWI